MRPHRLRVTAFGAFGGPVEVSFDDLASSGLFLLHGETGAGKTTLLDAIGFALYGRVPGERGKARRLRSDHAAPATPTEVELEETIGGRRMRITRKPEQERPKLRGTGSTTEQAKVLLEEFTGASWRAVSTRAGEADTEIADLMGMSADQFFQVVLLPQGEFAKFLHADAGDRAKLLQRLFGTDRFHTVEEWLADHRRVTARAVEEAEGGIKAHLARVTQAAGLEDSDDPEPSSEPQSASAPSLPGSRLPSATWAAQLAETAAAEAVASARPNASRTGSGVGRSRCEPATTWPAPKPACGNGAVSWPPPPAPPRSPPRWPRPSGPPPRSPRPAPPRNEPGPRLTPNPASAPPRCGTRPSST